MYMYKEVHVHTTCTYIVHVVCTLTMKKHSESVSVSF